MAKAMDDALLALYQNGERLRPEHWANAVIYRPKSLVVGIGFVLDLGRRLGVPLYIGDVFGNAPPGLVPLTQLIPGLMRPCPRSPPTRSM